MVDRLVDHLGHLRLHLLVVADLLYHRYLRYHRLMSMTQSAVIISGRVLGHTLVPTSAPAADGLDARAGPCFARAAMARARTSHRNALRAYLLEEVVVTEAVALRTTIIAALMSLSAVMMRMNWKSTSKEKGTR